MRLCVLGAGSWGTALAQALADNGHEVALWMRRPDQKAALEETGENKAYLPGVELSSKLSFYSNLKEIGRRDMILLAVPTQSQRAFFEAHKEFFQTQDKAIVVNVSKGLEAGSGKRLSVVFHEILGGLHLPYVGLYGPSHAEEVGRKMPTTLVAVSEDPDAAQTIQKLFMSESLRVYTSDDLIGVEVGGALKNIIAIAMGMAVGLGYGDNPRAAIMTRGLAEITRMGVALGANAQTFLGLTGVGDLFVTCTSEHSRNRRAGLALGQGQKIGEVQKASGMVIEGVATCEAAHELAEELGVSMPIVDALYRVLFEDCDIQEAARSLMTRDARKEFNDS